MMMTVKVKYVDGKSTTFKNVTRCVIVGNSANITVTEDGLHYEDKFIEINTSVKDLTVKRA